MQLSIAILIVLVDFLLAFARVGLEHLDLLHQPSSYQFTAFVRLIVAVVAWWKLPCVITSSDESKPRSPPVPLIVGGVFAAVWFAGAIASYNDWPTARYAGLYVGFNDGVLLFPVLEEIIYRQILLGALLTRFSALPAISINLAVFVLLHIGPYQGGCEANNLATWTLIGLATAICFARTGSVMACIVLHALINASLLAWQLQFGPISLF